jgi:ankyrin repeat protein
VRSCEDPSYDKFIDKPVSDDAAERGHLDVVKAMARLGANVNAKAEVEGQTALIAVGSSADAETIQLLVRKGANINEADDIGQTALMAAAGAGRLEAVQALLQLGANVNQPARLRSVEAMEAEGRGEIFSYDGKASRKFRATQKDSLETALMKAAGNGFAEVVEALIQAGADVDARDEDGEAAADRARENGYPTVLRVLRGGSARGAPEVGVRDLFAAIEKGDIAAARAALAGGADVNGKTTVRYEGDIKDGFTPLGGKPALVLAVERGDVPMAKFLLKAGADPNLCSNRTLFDNGQNALHVAAEKGHLELVRLLLAAGAKPDAKEIASLDSPALTPLQLATENKHRDVAAELLNTPQDPRKKPLANKGLHEAVEAGDKELVALLLRKGADVNALSQEFRMTPLMYAAFDAFPDITRQLLDAGAQVNATNKTGQTALTVAIHGAYIRSDWAPKSKRGKETLETIKVLLKRGADINATSWDDQTPLDMALDSHLKSISALLKRSGAKKRSQLRS